MLFLIAGLTTDNQIVNAVCRNIRTCYSTQRESMIYVVLPPLNFLGAIIAFAFLPTILCQDLIKSIVASYRTFTSAATAFIDSSLLRVIYCVLPGICSVFLLVGTIVLYFILCSLCDVLLTIQSSVLLASFWICLTIFFQFLSVAGPAKIIELPRLFKIPREIFSGKRLYLFTCWTAFMSIWNRFRGTFFTGPAQLTIIKVKEISCCRERLHALNAAFKWYTIHTVRLTFLSSRPRSGDTLAGVSFCLIIS